MSALNNETDPDCKTGIRVEIYRSITEVGESAWDAIVDKNRIFCTHKCVKVLEKSGVSEERCYYPVVYDGNEIIAHACVYFVRTEVDLFARRGIKKFIHLARRKWKDFFVLQSLECGPPISIGNTISFKNGIDRAGTLRLLCDEMERLAKGLAANFILFRDFYDKEMEFYDLLVKRGYMKIRNLPDAEIKIKWKSFNEYLDSMHSNYRRKIVKRMEKCAKANVSIRVERNFSENVPELKRLYDNVYDQAKEVKRERLSESFFQNISKYLGEDAVIISAVKDSKLIGYMLLLFSGKTLISKFPGLDYNYNKECCVYFNLFYKAIELAIETRMDCLDMSITTLDPKKDMGADIVALNMYMKHSNLLLNKIIPRLFTMMTQQDTSPRNVFK